MRMLIKKKKNVRLAAQTISSGVAVAIDSLRKSGHPDFIGSEATTEFIRIFDKIFDMISLSKNLQISIIFEQYELLCKYFSRDAT
jgi:hypothetical protein